MWHEDFEDEERCPEINYCDDDYNDWNDDDDWNDDEASAELAADLMLAQKELEDFEGFLD